MAASILETTNPPSVWLAGFLMPFWDGSKLCQATVAKKGVGEHFYLERFQ